VSIPQFVSAANPFHRMHFKVFLDDRELKNCFEAHAAQGWALCWRQNDEGRAFIDQHTQELSRELITGRVNIRPAYDGPFRMTFHEIYIIPMDGTLRRLGRAQVLTDTEWRRHIPAFVPGRTQWSLDYENISDVLGLSLYSRYAQDMVEVHSHYASVEADGSTAWI
jgi:hypothetical protein